MPTYEYRCPDGHDFEQFVQKISQASAALPCPVCGKVADRRISAGGGFVFKGSGFYITDYGKDGKKDQRDEAERVKKAEARSEGARGEAAKGDAKGEAAKSDAKGEGAKGDAKGDAKGEGAKSDAKGDAKSEGAKSDAKGEGAKGDVKGEAKKSEAKAVPAPSGAPKTGGRE